MKCPHCGQSLPASHYEPTWRNVSRHTYEKSLSVPWSSPSPAPTPNLGTFTEAIRRTPTREPNVPSDVMVPLFQALITAFVAAIVAFPLNILMQWPWYTFWWWGV